MRTQGRKRAQPRRRAATLILAALMITLLLGMVAFAVDVGYVFLVRTQLQVAADSGAMAGAATMIESNAGAVPTAQEFANRHLAGNRYVELQPADVEFGTWDFHARTFDAAGARPNALRVTTRRDLTTSRVERATEGHGEHRS